ncbi:MAG TPA: hypothetical protein VJ843_04640 [Candidatus Saccharimonadales bacterium]|nr:hypothetical protein [Candidatus Saccharimonadales bacterium]
MKNKQTHSTNLSTTKTHKKLTHINVRHVPDSGFYVPVISKLSTDYRNSGGSGGALKPQANPPDEPTH